MKHASTISKKEREDIFSLFTKRQKMRFSEIEKETALRSNLLNYHLDRMIDDGIIEKDGELYKLTRKAEKMIPFFSHMTGKEQGPLSIITAAILRKDEICLLRRNKRPYQGYWGLIGGKLRLSESIRDAALREAKEETNLDCRFVDLRAVLHERVRDTEVKHAFVIFFCELSTKGSKLRASDEGELCWFKRDDLPDNIIPSDRYMIEKLLKKDISCVDVIIEEKDGVLTDMKVADGGSL